MLIFGISELSSKMAGTEGFEPTMAGSKPAALPLGYVPIRKKICRNIWKKEVGII